MLFEVNIASARQFRPTVSHVLSLNSAYSDFFLYFLILLFYLLTISHCKVKSTFHGYNYFIFNRIRRKCFMFRNANFYRFHPTVDVFVDTFLLEFSFQNLFWSFLIEYSLCKPRKPQNLSSINRTVFNRHFIYRISIQQLS